MPTVNLISKDNGVGLSTHMDLLGGMLTGAGYDVLRTATDVKARLAAPPPKALLGLFHPRHMAVAFDKVGAGRYSDELALERNQDLRDQPMLADWPRCRRIRRAGST